MGIKLMIKPSERIQQLEEKIKKEMNQHYKKCTLFCDHYAGRNPRTEALIQYLDELQQIHLQSVKKS